MSLWGNNMNDNNNVDAPASQEAPAPEDIPMMQRLLDNPFVLLVLGIAVPAVFYIIWGIIEITQIPIAD